MVYRGRQTFAQELYRNVVSATPKDRREVALFSWVVREVAQKRCYFIWLLKVENENLAELEGRGNSKSKDTEVRKRITISKTGKKFGWHKGGLWREQGSEAKGEGRPRLRGSSVKGP